MSFLLLMSCISAELTEEKITKGVVAYFERAAKIQEGQDKELQTQIDDLELAMKGAPNPIIKQQMKLTVKRLEAARLELKKSKPTAEFDAAHPIGNVGKLPTKAVFAVVDAKTVILANQWYSQTEERQASDLFYVAVGADTKVLKNGQLTNSDDIWIVTGIKSENKDISRITAGHPIRVIEKLNKTDVNKWREHWQEHKQNKPAE